MYFRYKLIFILMFIKPILGSDRMVSSDLINTSETSCNDTELDACWKNLLSVSAHGIPSNPQKIEKACGVFSSGMECIDNWSRTCLSKEGQEKIENSIIGAVQMYKLLCTDNKFQDDYLKHANCYQRISPYWDDCNTKFTTNLKRIAHAQDTINLCCIRFRYTQCINDITRVLCSEEANKFLQSISESLMHSPLQAYHLLQCINVDKKNCSSSSSGESQFKFLMCASKMLMVAFWGMYHGMKFLRSSIT